MKADPHLHWRKNRRVISVLMLIWFLVTFVAAFFARDLDFDFFGWPFGFWVGSQGALMVYLAIVWGYASYMNHLDRLHGVDEDD